MVGLLYRWLQFDDRSRIAVAVSGDGIPLGFISKRYTEDRPNLCSAAARSLSEALRAIRILYRPDLTRIDPEKGISEGLKIPLFGSIHVNSG